MRTANISHHIVLSKTGDKQMSIIAMFLLHLLPGGLTMLLMLLVSPLLMRFGIYPGVPVLFVFVAPVLILLQLGYLYYLGKRLNGKYYLQGIVLYRNNLMPWWKTASLALLILAWIAFVFFIARPSLNRFFFSISLPGCRRISWMKHF